tara:strand:+ start:253 stop:648 length:396 start_codon:yes stop_codon:yes gene_type:complete
MSENKVIDGLIYSKEMEHYVDIKEWLQHIMSLANSTQDFAKFPRKYFEFDLKWTSCSDSEGNRHVEPYIKVYTGQQAEDVSKLLNDEGFEAAVDCYEADDGDDNYGRPIMINFWSVKLLGIKLKEVINIKN